MLSPGDATASVSPAASRPAVQAISSSLPVLFLVRSVPLELSLPSACCGQCGACMQDATWCRNLAHGSQPYSPQGCYISWSAGAKRCWPYMQWCFFKFEPYGDHGVVIEVTIPANPLRRHVHAIKAPGGEQSILIALASMGSPARHDTVLVIGQICSNAPSFAGALARLPVRAVQDVFTGLGLWIALGGYGLVVCSAELLQTAATKASQQAKPCSVLWCRNFVNMTIIVGVLSISIC